MSAFEVSDLHISYLVRAIHEYSKDGGMYLGEQRASNIGKHDLGAILLAENIRSVSYRYETGDEPTSDYRFQFVPYPDPVYVLKALDCYEYQSCEHPEWAGSDVQVLCDRLRAAAIRNLPGYSDAPWEITELDQVPA